jgi:putative sterol carrier protein
VPATKAIEELRKRFKPEAAKNFSATYLIAVHGDDGGVWLTKINDGKLEFIPQEEEEKLSIEPDCKISVSQEDLEAMMNGKLSAMTAALSGMLAIEGELGLAMQLVPIFFEQQSLI